MFIKTPGEWLNQAQQITPTVGAILSFGADRKLRDRGRHNEAADNSPMTRFLHLPRVAAPAILRVPRWKPPLQAIEPGAYASPYADEL